MKTLRILAAVLILLMTHFLANAQGNGLKIHVTKGHGDVYTVTDDGKRQLSFEITGINNLKHSQNIEKLIGSYRGVEEFNIIKIDGSDKWKATGTFYSYANKQYFQGLFKVMNASELYINDVKTDFENL